MAKISSTVHLEESTWEEIKRYMDQYGCSRNEAIERMFTERRLLLNLNVQPTSKQIITEEKITQRNDSSEIDVAVDSVYDEMPD